VKMCDEMLAIWGDFRDDPDVWVAIVTAVGDKFFLHPHRREGVPDPPDGRCLAADSAPHGGDPQADCLCSQRDLLRRGLHFVCDTDIIIGSENAQFFEPHVNVGFVSGWEPVGLSRRIPLNYVLRMTLQGKSYRMDAEEALRIAMITEVVPTIGYSRGRRRSPAMYWATPRWPFATRNRPSWRD